ncbi:MAG: ATP-binding cassette domain-containing protein [Fuerstiella sp.]
MVGTHNEGDDLIQVSGVYRHYGLQPIPRDISFRLNAGQTLSIIGPNGMGKTTLLNVIAGVACPAEGVVTINGLTRRASVEQELAIRSKRCFSRPNSELAESTRREAKRFILCGPFRLSQTRHFVSSVVLMVQAR